MDPEGARVIRLQTFESIVDPKTLSLTQHIPEKALVLNAQDCFIQ